MKRDKQVWNIVCLLTALSVFFVVMTEARPSRFPKPLVRREKVHMLTERKPVPDLAFFWHIGQRISRDSPGLSDTQKAQMKEEFWKLFIHAVAIQEDALNNDPRAHDKKDSALQKKTVASTQPVGQVFAGYLKATDDIFTPEQQNRHHKHHTGTKRPGRFYVVTNFWTQPITSDAMTDTKFVRSQSHAVEEEAEITQQFAWATLAQAGLQTPLHHDLSQLQILRL